MNKNILNAPTLVGAGLGGATGLGINRLLLGNKSILSNVLSAGIGGALGGLGGYYLNKYVLNPTNEITSTTKSGDQESSGKKPEVADNGFVKVDRSSAKAGKIPDSLALDIRRAVTGRFTEERAIELRDHMRDQGYSDAFIAAAFDAAESSVNPGITQTDVLAKSTAVGAGATGGELLRRGALRLMGGKTPESVTLPIINPPNKRLPVMLTKNYKTGMLEITGYPAATYTTEPVRVRLARVPKDVAKRIAEEAIGDFNIKQGLFWRLFGTKSVREQAKFIAANARKRSLSLAIGKRGLSLVPLIGGALTGHWLHGSMTNPPSDLVARFKKFNVK